MSLITRCAACRTAFRARPAQLAAHGGTVRCGKCGEVFDALAWLVEEDAAAVPPEAFLPPGPSDASCDPGMQRAHEPPELPAFMAEPRPQRRLLWWSLAGLAALALVAQAAYHLRSQIAAALPATRAPLEAACGLLGCDVPLPRRLALLSIVSYELHQDPRREELIVLNAVIRNRAPYPQEYPSLHLTLTDERNRPVASRSLAPQDYLEAARAPALLARGISAEGEAAITVYFDASRARASGYELVLFYPS